MPTYAFRRANGHVWAQVRGAFAELVPGPSWCSLATSNSCSAWRAIPCSRQRWITRRSHKCLHAGFVSEEVFQNKMEEVDKHCNSHPQGGTGRLWKIVLQQHPAARCTDQLMLNFLEWIRFHQPSRDLLTNFFHGRHMSRDLDWCVA